MNLEVRHEQFIRFRHNEPFAADESKSTPEQRRQFYERFFVSIDSAEFGFHESDYRIFGDTAVVWGFAKFRVKRKGEAATADFYRTMQVFSELNGKWRLVADHRSRIPSGDQPGSNSELAHYPILGVCWSNFLSRPSLFLA